MCARSDGNFSQLGFTRAYINLLCLPEDDVGMVSLAWLGNYEIRMLDVPQAADFFNTSGTKQTSKQQ